MSIHTNIHINDAFITSAADEGGAHFNENNKILGCFIDTPIRHFNVVVDL